MQTVVETPAFIAAAADAGMSDDERVRLVSAIASAPQDGDLMKGTGGARKVRFAKLGRGKSGSYRVITFYAGVDIPVFLLDCYAKGDKANLSKAERNELKGILGRIAKAYRTGAGPTSRAR